MEVPFPCCTQRFDCEIANRRQPRHECPTATRDLVGTAIGGQARLPAPARQDLLTTGSWHHMDYRRLLKPQLPVRVDGLEAYREVLRLDQLARCLKRRISFRANEEHGVLAGFDRGDEIVGAGA